MICFLMLYFSNLVNVAPKNTISKLGQMFIVFCKYIHIVDHFRPLSNYPQTLILTRKTMFLQLLLTFKLNLS